ncbi:efflux RND transporter periplasmic adaptor subunit [Chloroflexota bacterium]
MKNWQILFVLLLSLSLGALAACNPSAQGGSGDQQFEVVSGDLTVSVSGSGNIAISNEVSLYFGASGRVYNLYVDESEEILKGDILAELETDSLELALSQARVANGQAEVTLTQARSALQVAEYSLDEAIEPFTEQDFANAELVLDEAEYYLDYAEMKQENAWTVENMRFWEREVYRALISIGVAEQTLDDMLAGTDVEQIAILETQVIATQQSLVLAQQSLELSQQSLELVQKQLDEATITAPFTGVVASIYVDEGDAVTSATPIIYLTDPDSMELEIEIDEIDITSVAPGQRVVIEVDATSDVLYGGTVKSVGPAPIMESGLVGYGVTIVLEDSSGTELKLGMSATADIIISERNEVLLVPSRAVTRKDGEDFKVKVVINEDEVLEKVVVPGISDNLNTEIISGLEAGEIVIVEDQAR